MHKSYTLSSNAYIRYFPIAVESILKMMCLDFAKKDENLFTLINWCLKPTAIVSIVTGTT